jgi:hypothetical protein
MLEPQLRSKMTNFGFATPRRRIGGSMLLLAICALAAMGGGCQTAHVSESVATRYSGTDDDAQLNFWHELATRPVTSNDDAFHGLLLDFDGSDKSATYADRVATLKSRGMLADSFDQPADEAIQRGVLAVALVKGLGIKGGWVMHVFGNSPRYAVREMIYDDLFPPSSPQQTFSGTEFVGIIGKIDDYEQKPIASASANP